LKTQCPAIGYDGEAFVSFDMGCGRGHVAGHSTIRVINALHPIDHGALPDGYSAALLLHTFHAWWCAARLLALRRPRNL
jgi:hypothetical protein